MIYTTRVVSLAAGSKRSRQTYSKYQTAVLETVFQTSKYIVRSRRQQMSAELNLTERQIKIWFQNRRMKEKKCGVVHCKDSPPQPLADDRGGTAAMTAGYADDYCTELGRPAGYGPEDVFADFCVHGPEAARPRPPPQHHDPGYAGYGDCDGAGGGYDPPRARHEADPYAAAAAASKQHLHWGPPAPVAAVMDYDQDFFDDVSTLYAIPYISFTKHVLRTTRIRFDRFYSTTWTVSKDCRRPITTSTTTTIITITAR